MTDHLTLVSINRLNELLAVERSLKRKTTVSQFTACCDYLINNDDPVIKWNNYNQVVQCHNCGTIYIPTATKSEQKTQ